MMLNKDQNLINIKLYSLEELKRLMLFDYDAFYRDYDIYRGWFQTN